MKYPIPTLPVFVAVALTILIGDFFWLGYIARPMYDQLRSLLNPGFSKASLPYRLLPAVGAYLAMTLSLSTLAVPMVPTTQGASQRLLGALLWGGMWGLGVYGTYDFTNLAIIQAFPTTTALIDLVWGILVGSLGAFVGSYWA
jgi:uncharacterized membrane protein